jgi:hypothetical protein
MRRLRGVEAKRQIVAGLVLLATFLPCLRIGTYTAYGDAPVNLPHASGVVGVVSTPRHTPDWALPLAIAVGIAGATIALLILRPRRPRR